MSGRLCLLVLAALLLSACGDGNMDELQRYVKRVKAKPPKPIEPLPEIKAVDAFLYKDEERRNPFVMDRETAEAASPVVAASGIAPDPLRRKEELEQFSLDSLRMQGTLTQEESIWGLVRSPDGTLHRVGIGNHMGRNHGEIIRISEEEIELAEIVPDGQGTWREQRTPMALSQ